MFCSNCGKSIRPEDAACPHCGAVLGEDRFLGNMYTSSQVRLPVDALDRAPAGSLSAYTRTDYMSYDNQPEDDVYSNTTYRPVLDDAEDLTRQEEAEEQAAEAAEPAPAEDAPAEEAPEQQPEASQPEEEPAEPSEEAVEDAPLDAQDDDAPSTSPLPEIKPRGISPAVQRYMEEAEQRHQGQRGGLKLRLPFLKKQPQPEPEYDDEPAEDVPGAEAAQAPEAAEEEYDETYEDAAPEADAATYDETEDDGYEPELPDDGEYEDGEYEDEEEGGGRKPFSFKPDLSALKSNRTLQIAIASVLVLLVLIGGIRWLLYVTSNLGTKIAGVTHSTYSEGIKLIEQFSTDEYRDNLVKTGSSNADYAQQLMNDDMKKLNELMPEDPQENDDLFVTTLTIVHEGVQRVIRSDAAAVYNGTTEQRAAESAQEWAAVQNAVSNLKSATTVSQLTAVASDVQAAVAPAATATPAPTAPAAPSVTATPAPTELKEGMKDNAEVERMQRRLIELGYLANGADGDFGPKTTAALKAFQEAAGLTVDGVATQTVLDALYDANAPLAPATTTGEAAPGTLETIQV